METTAMKKKEPTKKQLYEAANRLLVQSGFGYDGAPKKRYSKNQKFFERRIVIMTPMGNGSR